MDLISHRIHHLRLNFLYLLWIFSIELVIARAGHPDHVTSLYTEACRDLVTAICQADKQGQPMRIHILLLINGYSMRDFHCPVATDCRGYTTKYWTKELFSGPIIS